LIEIIGKSNLRILQQVELLLHSSKQWQSNLQTPTKAIILTSIVALWADHFNFVFCKVNSEEESNRHGIILLCIFSSLIISFVLFFFSKDTSPSTSTKICLHHQPQRAQYWPLIRYSYAIQCFPLDYFVVVIVVHWNFFTYLLNIDNVFRWIIIGISLDPNLEIVS